MSEVEECAMVEPDIPNISLPSDSKLEKKIRKGRLVKKEITHLDLGDDFSSDLSPLELRNRINDALYNETELNDDYYISTLGVRYLRKYLDM